jgi:pimeloyl-ACP methyl ester carboxylesterase
LNVITTGNPDGPMVILLHGFPETALLAWHAQLQHFREQNKYFVVAPDMRGYNASEKPDGVKNYRLNELAQDVVDLIDHFGRETVMLVGHDWVSSLSSLSSSSPFFSL